jgi:hypothetical protein
MEEGEGTYEFHLVLYTEELLLRIHAGVGTIRKLGDELVPGDEVQIFLGQLVCEGTLDVVVGKREVGLHEGILVGDAGLLDDRLAGGDDSRLSTMALARVASQLRRVERGVGAGIGTGGGTATRR